MKGRTRHRNRQRTLGGKVAELKRLLDASERARREAEIQAENNAVVAASVGDDKMIIMTRSAFQAHAMNSPYVKVVDGDFAVKPHGVPF